jgi:hypothetical protein
MVGQSWGKPLSNLSRKSSRGELVDEWLGRQPPLDGIDVILEQNRSRPADSMITAMGSGELASYLYWQMAVQWLYHRKGRYWAATGPSTASLRMSTIPSETRLRGPD